MRSASSNSERVSFFKPGPARTFLENAGACTASILKPYPISGQRVCDFPFPVSNLFPNLRTKQNKQTTATTKTYLFLDHDSRDSTTLFYLSFKRPKSKTNLRQTGLKTIFFGPTHERVMAPPLGRNQVRGQWAASFGDWRPSHSRLHYRWLLETCIGKIKVSVSLKKTRIWTVGTLIITLRIMPREVGLKMQRTKGACFSSFSFSSWPPFTLGQTAIPIVQERRS